MKSYVYKFEDSRGKVLYIGKTNDIDRRMKEHFGGKGHIKGNCYKDTARVYYMQLNSDGDALLVEQYMIGKYNPVYNKLGKSKERVSISLSLEEKWLLYKINKKGKGVTKSDSKGVDLVMDMLYVGFILYSIRYVILLIL